VNRDPLEPRLPSSTVTSHAAAVLIVFWCFLLAGCGMTVTPPPAPDHPVTVYLTHHGIHTGLLLPREDGRLAQYSFSRWDWAALDEDQFYRAPFAALVPGKGTLGTRNLEGPFTLESLAACPELTDNHPPMDSFYPIVVDAQSCRQTLATLDARWQASASTARLNRKRSLNYIQDPADYSLANTCNTETASWLTSLGCTVTGAAMTSDIRVRSPGGADSRDIAAIKAKPPASTLARARDE